MGIVDSAVDRHGVQNVDHFNPQKRSGSGRFVRRLCPRGFLSVYLWLPSLLGFPRPYDNDELFK